MTETVHDYYTKTFTVARKRVMHGLTISISAVQLIMTAWLQSVSIDMNFKSLLSTLHHTWYSGLHGLDFSWHLFDCGNGRYHWVSVQICVEAVGQNRQSFSAVCLSASYSTGGYPVSEWTEQPLQSSRKQSRTMEWRIQWWQDCQWRHLFHV